MRKWTEQEHIKKINQVYNSNDFGHYIKFLGIDENDSNKYWYFCEIHQQKFFRSKDVILNGNGCDDCRKERQIIKDIGTYVKFKESFKVKHPNWRIKSWYKSLKEPIKIECEHGHVWEVSAGVVMRKENYHCPYCIHQMIPIEESIYTLRPDLIKYFKNPEDAKHVSLGSMRKVPMICPDCGYEKNFSPYKLIKRGFGCLICGDGLSYGEKFLREVNNQIKDLEDVDYECYYIKDQKLGMIKDNYFFYDCKFSYHGKKFFIEMDGDGHQEDTKPRGFFTKEELENRRKADKEKDLLAKREDRIIIRINFYGETRMNMEEIFLESDFAKYIDLSNINWDKCREKAESNLTKEVCKYVMEHKLENRKEIAEKFQICLTSIYNYIRVGRRLGWIDDSVPNIKETSYKAVLCYDKDMNFIKEFPSVHSICAFLNVTQSKVDRATHPDSKSYLVPINGYIIKLKNESQAYKRKSYNKKKKEVKS